MNAPTQYRTQLQQQHQEGGEAPPAANLDPTEGPVPDGAGDDDIIADLLKDKSTREPREREPRRRELEPEDDAPEPIADEEPEPDAEEEPDDPPDDDEDLDEEDVPEAAEADEEDAPRGSLKAARAAYKAGDIEKACLLAFGVKPEEISPNPHVWTSWRKANEREELKHVAERRQLDAERAEFNQAAHGERVKLSQTIEALRPYEKFYVAEQAWHREGDPSHLVEIIQGITRMTYDEAQKIILTKTKRSPAERQMAARLQELERKLQETSQQREQQQQQQTQAQVYQADLAHIRQHVTGPVAKIPKFAERIYKVLAETRNAAGLTLTVEQAAQRVAKAERKRIESHPFVRRRAKDGKPTPSEAGRALASQRRSSTGSGKPPLRRDSQNNGAVSRDKETDDDIINDILSNRRRRVG